MILIRPEYLPLTRLLNRRLFQIPEYQRAYSWTSRQRGDLFSDIRKTHEKGLDTGHFMAAVVCLRRRIQHLGTDEFDVLDVVDGQQRLTTLIILLNSIRLALKPDEKGEQKLAGELRELLVKPEGDELLLLQTNHDSSHYFANFLRSGITHPSHEAKTTSDREILKAIEECNAFVSQWIEGGEQLPLLAALLKNRLFFLLHEIEEEKSVYTVFEVLNSRGLDVSAIDRLKSILMGNAFELKGANNKSLVADLHTAWRDIYTVIGLRQGLSTEALRFAATLYLDEAPNRPLSEDDSVETLREQAGSAKGIREVANWLLSVTRACDNIHANPRINAVTGISQARLLAVAINLRLDIGDKDRAALLTRWEKVSFRIYGMLGKDKRFRVGEYVRLAWRVVNEKPTAKEIDAGIKEIGEDFPIDEAVEALRKTNCYDGWENELRYLMFRYEEYLSRMRKLNFCNEQWEKIWMVSASDSIEHILPQSRASERTTHRLGNLVLLPPNLNSKLQAIDPEEKVKSYRETGLLIANEVADMIESKGWNLKAIERREGELLKWAATEWAD